VAAFAIVASILSACASPRAPAGSPAAAPAQVVDFCRSAVQPAWSLRRRVVHLAACEWAAFDRPQLLLEQGGWPEAQVAFGPDESSLAVWDRVGEYWDVADPRHAAEVRAARVRDRELWPAWRRPWSAAFISWVMREAGAQGFTADRAHSGYLAAAYRRDPASVVDVAGYRPEPGDLVCAGRSWGPRTAAELLAWLQHAGGYFPSHCDVVVEVGPDRAVLIGGNVKNGVAATVTPLREGRIAPTTTRPWAVAYILEAEADPCATLTPGPAC